MRCRFRQLIAAERCHAPLPPRCCPLMAFAAASHALIAPPMLFAATPPLRRYATPLSTPFSPMMLPFFAEAPYAAAFAAMPPPLSLADLLLPPRYYVFII